MKAKSSRAIGASGAVRQAAVPAVQTYSLKEVAEQVGLDVRVIRSWMAPPYRILTGPGRGSGKRYGQAFLDRAKLVQRMRSERYTLADITQRLRTVGDEEVPSLLAQFEPGLGARPRESAAEYAARALRTRGIRSSIVKSTVQASQLAIAARRGGSAPRSTWERVPLREDIELHVRRPTTREGSRILEKILAEVSKVLGEP